MVLVNHSFVANAAEENYCKGLKIGLRRGQEIGKEKAKTEIQNQLSSAINSFICKNPTNKTIISALVEKINKSLDFNIVVEDWKKFV